MLNYDITNIKLAPQGKKRIEWSDHDMPVLKQIRQKWIKTKPLKGIKTSSCMHVTCETANLMRTLKAGGADVFFVCLQPLIYPR